MMKYPKLIEIPTSRDILDKFKGYNHNLRIGDGEFYDMKNLTGDNYPVLSPRKVRSTYLSTNKPNGMCSNTDFCYVDGKDFYIGENKYDLRLTDTSKDLVSIGTRIVVMPDQKYINTIDPSERGNIRNGIFELPNTGADGSTPKIKITITGLEDVPRIVVGSKADLPMATREIWLEKVSSMVITSARVEWYRVGMRTGTYNGETYYIYDWIESTYTNIHVSSGGNTYSVYATTPYYSTTISLEDGDEDNWSATLEQIKTAMGNEKIYLKGLGDTIDKKAIKIGIDNKKIELNSDWFNNVAKLDVYLKDLLFGRTTPAEINTPYIKDGTLAITAPYNAESTIPILDHLIESGNRLWGCRYGTNNSGEFVNEIYATVLGDFKNWFKYDGISTDAWTTSVGTSGAFTGAVNFGGKPIFFKEDCMHRIYGEYVPYSAQMIPCKGVQEGCHKSLAIVNDVLYYKSRTGICAYDGSIPVEISTNFGDKQYFNAVGGSIGNKYYISMQDEEGEWSLFVYDTVKRMWHKEDNTQVTQFCNHQGELYYIDHADHFIHTVKGTKGVRETAPIKWGAETGILGATTPDNKYVTRIDVRMAMAKGSRVSLYIEYDSMGEWERLMGIEGLTLNTFTIPVIPRRCDHFRLKIEGDGDAKIFSISKTLEETE